VYTALKNPAAGEVASPQPQHPAGGEAAGGVGFRAQLRAGTALDLRTLGLIQNNRASDIVTHHWSFLQGLTGKDERLNEDTTASKVSVGVE
jgi:hypothetical protein